LLVGLEHVAPETTILAFVDSDVQVHPHWLEALVTPLNDATVGQPRDIAGMYRAVEVWQEVCARPGTLPPHPHGAPTVWICLGWIDGHPA
jgi:hypothetical protein